MKTLCALILAFFIPLFLIICIAAFYFPNTFGYYKYKNVPSWADPSSDNFITSYIDLGYYLSHEDKARVVNKIFPLGMKKNDAEKILYNSGFNEPWTEVGSGHIRYYYTVTVYYYNFMYFIPIPFIEKYRLDLVFDEMGTLVSRNIGSLEITVNGELNYND